MTTCSLCARYLYPWQKRIIVTAQLPHCHEQCAATWLVGYLNCATDLLKKYGEQLQDNIKAQLAMTEKRGEMVH